MKKCIEYVIMQTTDISVVFPLYGQEGISCVRDAWKEQVHQIEGNGE